MSDLTYAERKQLEQLLGMESGYVLGFSDKTFRDFVHDSTGVDLYDEAGTYRQGSGSKANRLRAFWSREDNHLVGKLLHDLMEDRRAGGGTIDPALFDKCQRIADRLQQGAPVADLAALKPNSDNRDFDTVVQEAKAAIDNNKPEAGLDRLHTFMVFFVRTLCDARGVNYSKDTALHALFGQYVQKLRADGAIESEMAKQILRACNWTLDAFNDVRNNKSLAHANAVLNSDEALFIYSHVCSAVRFLQVLEKKRVKADPQPQPPSWLRKAPG